MNRGVWEVLVHWLGRANTDTSWEQLEEFKVRYPQVQLADELFVGEEGNVIDAFLGRKYFRRKRHTAREGEAAERGESVTSRRIGAIGGNFSARRSRHGTTPARQVSTR
jgi:hypothetical protein